MASLEDLEQQLAALKDRLGMEAGLRASQDGDLSALASAYSAQQHSIQALAITQSEHNMQIAQMRRAVEENNRLITSLNSTLAVHGDALRQIVTLLDGLSSQE